MPRSSKSGKGSRPALGKGLGSLLKAADTHRRSDDGANGREDVIAEAGEAAQTALAGAQMMDIAAIRANKHQPRRHFADDEMATLIESVKSHGIIQPIVVRPVEDYYQIVAGERRWRAAGEAGLTTVPVIVKNYSTEEMTEIALVENLQRQNLDPIEEASAYRRLADMFHLKQEDIALRLGRSRSHVANMMRLLQLPEFVRNELSAGEISIGQARPLLALADETLQRTALDAIKEQDLTARQVEHLVHRLSTKAPKAAAKRRKDDAETRALAERLKLTLGVPVAIKLQAGKAVRGKIEVTFRNQAELDQVLQYMEHSGTAEEERIDAFHM